MSTQVLIGIGIVVLIIFVIGLLYTFKEFGEMEEDPESYRLDRSEEPDVKDGEPESKS